ncbi:MAG: choice-of-anchor V domain-containing protein [Bacteroidota bacterium]
MNKIYTKKLILISFSLFVLIVFMSNSAGRGSLVGQALTGAPGDSNRTCASSGCHSSGAFSPSVNLDVFDPDGNEVTSFIPGETYDITLRVDAMDDPDAYGFQMVALLDDETAATDWSEVGDNIQVVQLGERNYLEHDSPSASNEFKTKWTAPVEGSGNVTFYYSANAVNGNGSASGDGGVNSQFRLFETTTSTENVKDLIVTVYPNPTSDFITITDLNSEINYTIVDPKGQKVSASKSFGETTIDLRDFNTGLYFLTIQKDDMLITKRIFKK